MEYGFLRYGSTYTCCCANGVGGGSTLPPGNGLVPLVVGVGCVGVGTFRFDVDCAPIPGHCPCRFWGRCAIADHSSKKIPNEARTAVLVRSRYARPTLGCQFLVVLWKN